MESSVPHLHIIIFSKDRAMQVHSLLCSLRDHFKVPVASVHVVYKATDETFAAAYDTTARETILPAIRWIKESSFRDDVLRIVQSIDDTSLIMFLVDDDIFYRPFDDVSLLNRLSRKHLFISLRSSRSYPADTPPVFSHADGFLEWKWNYSKKHWVTWNYPFSVDGHIFRVSVIKRVLRRISFKAPNSLEGNMHRYRHAWWVKWTPLGLAPLESVVYNNPLNKVQAEGETWNQGISAEELNRKFLEGRRIDNRRLYTATPVNTHTAVVLEFQPGPLGSARGPGVGVDAGPSAPLGDRV